MASVFISYSRSDSEAAGHVEEKLRESGFETLMDKGWEIAAGATWKSMMDEQCESATCVLVLWSEEANQSEWVRREAETGRARGRLLQVTLDDCPPPFPFSEYNYGSLQGWDGLESHPGFQKIVQGVRFFIERESLPRSRWQRLKRFAGSRLQKFRRVLRGS